MINYSIPLYGRDFAIYGQGFVFPIQFKDPNNCAISRAAKKYFNTTQVSEWYTIFMLDNSMFFQHEYYGLDEFGADKRFVEQHGPDAFVRAVLMTPVNGVVQLLPNIAGILFEPELLPNVKPEIIKIENGRAVDVDFDLIPPSRIARSLHHQNRKLVL